MDERKQSLQDLERQYHEAKRALKELNKNIRSIEKNFSETQTALLKSGAYGLSAYKLQERFAQILTGKSAQEAQIEIKASINSMDYGFCRKDLTGDRECFLKCYEQSKDLSKSLKMHVVFHDQNFRVRVLVPFYPQTRLVDGSTVLDHIVIAERLDLKFVDRVKFAVDANPQDIELNLPPENLTFPRYVTLFAQEPGRRPYEAFKQAVQELQQEKEQQ